MKYEVIFFEDNRGRSPVKDFLDELQIEATHKKSAKQLLSKIFLYRDLRKTGSRSGLPFTKFIGNGKTRFIVGGILLPPAIRRPQNEDANLYRIIALCSISNE